MDDWNDFRMFEPLRNTLVIIKTNWSTYLAALVASPFGGYEFAVAGSAKTVQVTAVMCWKPAQ